MIFIIDNGRGYEDRETHYVEAPDRFGVWWREQYVPWQKARKHDPQKEGLHFELLGACPSVTWETGHDQQEEFPGFIENNLREYVDVRGRRQCNRPPEFKPW